MVFVTKGDLKSIYLGDQGLEGGRIISQVGSTMLCLIFRLAATVEIVRTRQTASLGRREDSVRGKVKTRSAWQMIRSAPRESGREAQ